MGILFSARTDVGRVREGNEDNFLVDRKLQLYVVCDGMGGHLGGEVASATAVNVVRDHLVEHRETLEAYQANPTQTTEGDVLRVMEQAIQQASFRIYQRGVMNPEQRGMGTTCSGMVILSGRAFIGHVGDSRVYVWRDGAVQQLTEDHSLYNEMVRSGQLAPEEHLAGRLKNAVTRAVGVYESVQVDTLAVPLQAGDRFLLCSDGLCGYADDSDLEGLLAIADLDRSAEGMINFANKAGGRDNITAVLVQVPAEGVETGVLAHAIHFQAVRALPLFSPLSDAEVRNLMSRMEVVDVPAGEFLLVEDSPADAMIAVLSGQLAVCVDSETVAVVAAGEVTGEFSLLGDAPHRAGLRASEPTTVIKLPRAAFRQVLVTDRTLGARLAWQLAQSLGRRLLLGVTGPEHLGTLYSGGVGAPRKQPAQTEPSVDTLRNRRAQRMLAPTVPRLNEATTGSMTTQDLDPIDILDTSDDPEAGTPPLPTDADPVQIAASGAVSGE